MALTLIIPRPEADARSMAGQAQEYGLHPIISPLFSIENFTPDQLPPYDALIATSPYALHAGVLALLSPKSECYVVGERAALLLRAAGHSIVSVHPNAESLIPSLPLEKHYLYLRAEDAAADIASLIATKGGSADDIVTYRAAPTSGFTAEAMAALQGQEPVALFLGSARTAQRAIELIPSSMSLEHCSALCLSEVIAGFVRSRGFGRVLVAPQPDAKEALTLLRS